MALPGSESRYLITSLAALACLAPSENARHVLWRTLHLDQKEVNRQVPSPGRWNDSRQVRRSWPMARSPVLTTSACGSGQQHVLRLDQLLGIVDHRRLANL